MYEVLSEQSFMEKKDFDLIQAIVIRKERPSLQKIKAFPDLKELIEDCWQDQWAKRPTFDCICGRLMDILNYCIKEDN